MIQSGIDTLRLMVNYFNYCREDFNTAHTFDQLVRIYKVARACDWDFYPDHWTQAQLSAALIKGHIPNWDANERPIKATKVVGFKTGVVFDIE